MELDPDTFLTALYVITDDLYRRHFAHLKPRRRGKKVELSDSEVLTLAICNQWLGWSERAMIRYALSHWRSYFPRLLSHSAYNRRSRDLSGVLVGLGKLVARELEAYTEAYQVMDSVAVPLERRCRGSQHRLFGDEAGIGKGGADHAWYYGVKLLLSVSPSGLITGFMIAPASTEDRWVAEHLLCWREDRWAKPLGAKDMPRRLRYKGYVGPTGPIWPRDAAGKLSLAPYIADRGFSGAWWIAHWHDDYEAKVLTASSYKGEEARAAQQEHSRWRQIVETVNGLLTTVFSLSFPGARTKWGLLTRLAAKVAAVNMGIYLNRLFGRPDLSHASLFPR